MDINNDAKEETKIEIAGITHIGMVRKSNQDAFIVVDLNNKTLIDTPEVVVSGSIGTNGWLLAVADGMGGAAAGDVASRMTTEQITSRLTTDMDHQPIIPLLRESIKLTNREIWQLAQSQSEYQGMGATLTAAIIKDGRAIIAQVGDSRGYLIRKGHIHQITKDQSLVQALIDAGQITEEDALTFSYRNIILHAMGVENDVDPEIGAVVLKRGDYLLLCSDGLSNKVGNVEMHNIVLQAANLSEAAEQLIKLANERGGEDNSTLILAQVNGTTLPEPNPDTGKLIPVEKL